LAILIMPGTPFVEKIQWKASFEHRRARLQDKLERQSDKE